MKKLTLIIYFISFSCYAQVTIGKDNISSSAILEFGMGEKVLVLPKITNPDPDSVPGTLIFNQQIGKVQFFTESGWINMNDSENEIEAYSENEIGGGVIISDLEVIQTQAPGVLVLESNNKGLVLPKVYDVINSISNPIPGSICYDTRKNSVAVYNGIEWTFWN